MELNFHKDCLQGAHDKLNRVHVGGWAVHHQWWAQDGRLHPHSLAPLWRPLDAGSLCWSPRRQVRGGRQRFHSLALSHLWVQGSEKLSCSLVAGHCS